MVQLKDRQPQEMESKLKFHSSLMLMAQVLVPCWIQFYLAAWKKTTQWCLGSSSFSLVIGGIVALNCILNGCCTLPMKVQFLRLMPQKLTVPPQGEVTHVTGRRHALWHLWKSTTWRFLCRGLTQLLRRQFLTFSLLHLDDWLWFLYLTGKVVLYLTVVYLTEPRWLH